MTTATLWVALTLAAPAAARSLHRRLAARLEPWASEVAFWSSAAYGVLPLYGAWITGAVIGRDCGLSGFTPSRWLSGIAICGVLLALLALSLRMRALDRLVQASYDPGDSWLTLFHEPRWAFYRGAGAVMVASPAGSQLIGLILGAIEWGIGGGRPRRGAPPRVWSGLARLVVSAILFALTHNLWLILLTQAAARALIVRSRAVPAPSA